MPLFSHTYNMYKTDKNIYVVSNRDLTERSEEDGNKLIDTNVLIYQIT